MSPLLLVTYDVADDRRRRRVAKTLEGFGRRVQHSVFECRLRPAERAALERTLGALLPPEGPDEPAFSLRTYRLCAACSDQVEVVGPATHAEDPLCFIA